MSKKQYLLMSSLAIFINSATGAQENPADELFAAAIVGNFEQAKNILQQHPEVARMSDDQGSTPLHWAAARDFPAIAKLLIANGADVDAENRHEATALHLAAAKGSLPMVRLLLQHGADLQARTANRETVLHKAALSQSPALTCFLVAKLAKDKINAQTMREDTALHLAAGTGDLESVKILLGQGADMNVKNSHQRTALYDAADYGFEDVVRYLIRSGMPLDEVTKRLISTRFPHYNWRKDRQEYDIQRQQELIEHEPKLPAVLGEIIGALAD